MSGVVQSKFRLTVPHGGLHECIAFLEEGMRSLKETPYHAVLGRNYLHHVQAAAAYIAGFFREATRDAPLGAMYFEMNGFAINPDQWYFDGSGYRKGGSVWDLTWNTDWLSPWDVSTRHSFTLSGLEGVQRAFGDLYCDDNQPLGVQLAGEIAEHLVVARFDELIGAAHAAAKAIYPTLAGIPVLSTAHDWDTLYPSQ